MRPGDAPLTSSAPRTQGPSVVHVPGPRPAAAAPIRLASESDTAVDLMSRGRSQFSDDVNVNAASNAFIRSRQAEEAAARARSLSNENQMNLRTSPWQDGDSDRSGSTTVAGVRRPPAVPLGDGGGGSVRVVQHAPAPSAPESLAVFEKPLLAALSGDDVGGMSAAEVTCRARFPPHIIEFVTNLCRNRLTRTWHAPATTSAWAGLRASTGRVCQRTPSTALSSVVYDRRT
jgi:hypothetical protein